MTVLGALRDVLGRKVLLYFGRRLAPLDLPLDLDLKTVSRLLDDASITLYVVAPTDVDRVSSSFGELARATGGDLLGNIQALETTLPRLLERTSATIALLIGRACHLTAGSEESPWQGGIEPCG